MAWRVIQGVAQNPSFPGSAGVVHGMTTRSLGDQKTAGKRWAPNGAHALVVGEQVHGTRIEWVTKKLPGAPRPMTDGLLTAEPGVALGVFTADCAPVFLAWPEKKIVGVVHAGRRGLAAGIIGATCRALAQRTGQGDLSGLRVAVGPHIQSCCYFLSLAGEITRQFSDYGVAVRSLSFAPFCTMEDPRFFSHRRDQDSRRMLSCILRVPKGKSDVT